MRKKNAVWIFLLLLLCAVGPRVNAAGSGTKTVTVDFSKPLQTIQGFGAAITWVAGNLGNFSTSDQTRLLDALYSTTQPSAALSWIRVGTMLCQFNPSSGSYNFNDPLIQGEVSWVNRVSSTYGVNNVFASTWTPPAWMKSNGSCDGGSLLSQYYPDFANTVVLWLQDWKAAVGREVGVESLQNEPNVSASYDSCTYTMDQINTVTTGYLKPAMQSAGVTSLYTVPESSVYGGTSFYDTNYAIPILSNSTMDSEVDFMTTHGYGQLQNLAQPCQTCQQYNKPIWQTEVMDSKGTYNNSITEGQKWSTSIYQALNKGGFSAWYYWWAIYDNNNNGGLIKWDSTTTPWTFDIPKRVYTIGNFSRFMRRDQCY